jgi:hypothetical protein
MVLDTLRGMKVAILVTDGFEKIELTRRRARFLGCEAGTSQIGIRRFQST